MSSIEDILRSKREAAEAQRAKALAEEEERQKAAAAEVAREKAAAEATAEYKRVEKVQDRIAAIDSETTRLRSVLTGFRSASAATSTARKTAMRQRSGIMEKETAEEFQEVLTEEGRRPSIHDATRSEDLGESDESRQYMADVRSYKASRGARDSAREALYATATELDPLLFSIAATENVPSGTMDNQVVQALTHHLGELAAERLILFRETPEGRAARTKELEERIASRHHGMRMALDNPDMDRNDRLVTAADIEDGKEYGSDAVKESIVKEYSRALDQSAAYEKTKAGTEPTLAGLHELERVLGDARRISDALRLAEQEQDILAGEVEKLLHENEPARNEFLRHGFAARRGSDRGIDHALNSVGVSFGLSYRGLAVLREKIGNFSPDRMAEELTRAYYRSQGSRSTYGFGSAYRMPNPGRLLEQIAAQRTIYASILSYIHSHNQFPIPPVNGPSVKAFEAELFSDAERERLGKISSFPDEVEIPGTAVAVFVKANSSEGLDRQLQLAIVEQETIQNKIDQRATRAKELLPLAVDARYAEETCINYRRVHPEVETLLNVAKRREERRGAIPEIQLAISNLDSIGRGNDEIYLSTSFYGEGFDVSDRTLSRESQQLGEQIESAKAKITAAERSVQQERGRKLGFLEREATRLEKLRTLEEALSLARAERSSLEEKKQQLETQSSKIAMGFKGLYVKLGPDAKTILDSRTNGPRSLNEHLHIIGTIALEWENEQPPQHDQEQLEAYQDLLEASTRAEQALKGPKAAFKEFLKRQSF